MSNVATLPSIASFSVLRVALMSFTALAALSFLVHFRARAISKMSRSVFNFSFFVLCARLLSASAALISSGVMSHALVCAPSQHSQSSAAAL